LRGFGVWHKTEERCAEVEETQYGEDYDAVKSDARLYFPILKGKGLIGDISLYKEV
jgi:hypothetical protein